MAEELFLNDVWNVYFHDPLDVDWTIPSYIRLSSISSVEQYWENMNCMKSQVHKGIFFIMREYVFPCWDDINNINQCCSDTYSAFAGVSSINNVRNLESFKNCEECVQKSIRALGRDKCNFRITSYPVWTQSPHYFPNLFQDIYFLSFEKIHLFH